MHNACHFIARHSPGKAARTGMVTGFFGTLFYLWFIHETEAAVTWKRLKR